MASKDATFEFGKRLQMLESLRREPLLQAVWPTGKSDLTLEDALRAAGHAERAEELGRIMRVSRAGFEMLTRPIIAVLGELNAGKSSVIASFLSPEGRERVPRGEENEQGTHRFVYWVPTTWLANEATKKELLGLLAAAHGDQIEYLSNDPARASVQYRSGRDHLDLLRVPLLGADPALDALSAAFLDCPDVQTRDRHSDPPGGDGENPRLGFVCDASRICSALWLVWDRVKIRDGLLEDFLRSLRARKAEAPLFLLINKIRPERGQPTRSRNDEDLCRLMAEFQVAADACYGAFDFDILARRDAPGWSELTPPELVTRHHAGDARAPQFFSLSQDDEANRPNAIGQDRFLITLPARLNLATLQRQKMADNWVELRREIAEDLARVTGWMDGQHRRARELHHGLLSFCVRPFTDSQGNALQLTTHEFSNALKDSFARTAPWYVRLPLKVASPFEQAVAATAARIGDVRHWIQRLRSPDTALSDLTRELGQSLRMEGTEVTNARTMAREMRGLRWVPAEMQEEALESAWQEILSQLVRNPLALAPEAVDAMTREIWEAQGAWQKTKTTMFGLFRALGAIAAIGGLVTAVVDGGATLLISSKLSATIAWYVPGLKALLIAGSGAAGAFVGFQLRAIELNTLPYLSRLFALSCDVFGVPRRLNSEPVIVTFGTETTRCDFTLPEPRLAEQSAICRLERLQLWRRGPGLALWEKAVADG